VVIPVDDRVEQLARRQHWIVTRAQLAKLGLTGHAIDWRIARRVLKPLHRGVFLFGHTEPPHLALETAALLAVGPKAVLSHETAAYLHTLFPHPAKPVHVTVIGRSLASREGITIHRTATLARSDIIRHEGLAVTSLARAILDLAATRDRGELEPLVSEAMRKLRLPERALHDQLDRNPGRPGTRSLRTVLDGPGGPAFTRSKAERRLLQLVRAARLPPPQSCAKVGGHEVDLLWPEHKLVVEFDGYRFHGDRQAFETDRRRDARLVALGYVVLRITWRRLVDEAEAVIAELGAVLARRRSQAA
jgi:very-short-patch-repair endonuclease